MRKLLCLAVFLLGLILPCAAEEPPAVPEWPVGEWKAVLAIDGAAMHAWTDEDAPRLHITEDGYLIILDEGAPRYPLTCGAETDKWYISDPVTGETLLLYLDSQEQLTIGTDANLQVCCLRKDASPVYLPYQAPALSYGGDWSVWSLYTETGAMLDFSYDCFENVVNMDPILTITIPPFPTLNAIQQAWQAAVSQTADDCPLRALQVSGFDLRNEYTLLLITQHGLLELCHNRSPELDPAFQEKIDDLAGWWYPDEISVGGISLPASAMGMPDEPIVIDEQGNVLLPDGTVTAFRLEEDTLLLGEYPVSGDFSLTLAEDVELDFISEQDWCRKQLNGDWQLRSIEVPALGLKTSVDPAVTDVTLNIDPYDDWCHMDSDKYLISSYYDQAPNEFTLIPLYGDDRFTLTIVNPDTVQVMPKSGSYTLTFTRIENTDE